MVESRVSEIEPVLDLKAEAQKIFSVCVKEGKLTVEQVDGYYRLINRVVLDYYDNDPFRMIFFLNMVNLEIYCYYEASKSYHENMSTNIRTIISAFPLRLLYQFYGEDAYRLPTSDDPSANELQDVDSYNRYCPPPPSFKKMLELYRQLNEKSEMTERDICLEKLPTPIMRKAFQDENQEKWLRLYNSAYPNNSLATHDLFDQNLTKYDFYFTKRDRFTKIFFLLNEILFELNDAAIKQITLITENTYETRGIFFRWLLIMLFKNVKQVDWNKFCHLCLTDEALEWHKKLNNNENYITEMISEYMNYDSRTSSEPVDKPEQSGVMQISKNETVGFTFTIEDAVHHLDSDNEIFGSQEIKRKLKEFSNDSNKTQFILYLFDLFLLKNKEIDPTQCLTLLDDIACCPPLSAVLYYFYDNHDRGYPSLSEVLTWHSQAYLRYFKNFPLSQDDQYIEFMLHSYEKNNKNTTEKLPSNLSSMALKGLTGLLVLMGISLMWIGGFIGSGVSAIVSGFVGLSISLAGGILWVISMFTGEHKSKDIEQKNQDMSDAIDAEFKSTLHKSKSLNDLTLKNTADENVAPKQKPPGSQRRNDLSVPENEEKGACFRAHSVNSFFGGNQSSETGEHLKKSALYNVKIQKGK